MLTTEQRATLRTYVLSVPALATMYNDGNLGGLADALSAEHSPAFVCWRNEYTAEQIANAIDAGITQLDALTPSKRDSLLWWAQRTHDAGKATTQAAWNDLCGSQNTLKAAITDGAKRNATVLERCFATGTGSTAAPATLVVTGGIGWSELIGM